MTLYTTNNPKLTSKIGRVDAVLVDSLLHIMHDKGRLFGSLDQ